MVGLLLRRRGAHLAGQHLPHGRPVVSHHLRVPRSVSVATRYLLSTLDQQRMLVDRLVDDHLVPQIVQIHVGPQGFRRGERRLVDHRIIPRL
jgi:hypothetical protein